MRNFLSALRFLTIIPIGTRYADEDLPKAMIYFPVVGLLLGALLLGVNDFLTILHFDSLALNIIVVIVLIAVTGGLHLDGLADTCDAIASGKDKEKILEVMHDPHIGTMGVLSLLCSFFLKISFLYSMSVPLKTAAFIVMCVLGRWSLVFSIFLFPYARREGKAKVFIEGIRPGIFVLSTVIALAFTVMAWSLRGLIIFGIIAVSVYMFNRFIENKIGGITGDTLGATNELAEVVVLLSMCSMERINL